MEILKIKSYKIKITEEIKSEVIKNQYFRSGAGIDHIQLNQCPICGHTNINMDQYIFGCIGFTHIYLHLNKLGKKGNVNDFRSITPAKLLLIKERNKNNAGYHDPVEMTQRIVYKSNASRLRVNAK